MTSVERSPITISCYGAGPASGIDTPVEPAVPDATTRLRTEPVDVAAHRLDDPADKAI
jgi:hypothetical protein